MSVFSSLEARIGRLPWLFIETPARAAGYLTVLAIAAVLIVRLEFGNSWNLYAAGRQTSKAGDDYPLVLQAIGNAFVPTGDELVVFLGGSAVRELTADDALVSRELTSRCGRGIRFVNLGSSSQTFSESWDIAALAPETGQRLLLVGINPYRLSFGDSDVSSELSHDMTGVPVSYSLLWSVALHTGHMGSPERMFASIARQDRMGAKWRFADLLVPPPPVARPPSADPFQPDRSSYGEPVWTRAQKLRQANEYIATRALDFHNRFREGAKWFNRLYDHFKGPQSDVKFVIAPTDETFGKVDRLIADDFEQALTLLGGDSRILDLRGEAKNSLPTIFSMSSTWSQAAARSCNRPSLPRRRTPSGARPACRPDMSRIVFSLIVCLGVIGMIEAAGFGKPIELHVYRLSVSPDGDPVAA